MYVYVCETILFNIYRDIQSNNIYTSEKIIKDEKIDKIQRF